MTVSLKQRSKILERDEHACHHIIPRRKQGIDSPNNLITVCEVCHFLIELEPMSNTTRRKSVSLNEETYNELISLSSGYKESIDDIVKKCIKAYRKVNKK
jgi:predicted lactoylglutathione lyase